MLKQGGSMSLSKDLVAASAEPLILSVLLKGDSYGYAIIKDIHTISSGKIQWTDGMLYPVLHRLEKKGVIDSYWGTSENGRKRKYYKLVREGNVRLKAVLEEWQIASSAIAALNGGGNEI